MVNVIEHVMNMYDRCVQWYICICAKDAIPIEIEMCMYDWKDIMCGHMRRYEHV